MKRTCALLMLLSCAGPTASSENGEAVPPPESTTEDIAAQVAKLEAEAAQDPLLAPWTGPYEGVPPWDQVKAEMFPTAFTKGLALLKAEVATIASHADPPTFENTMAALENAGRYQNRA